jgi:endoglucanase
MEKESLKIGINLGGWISQYPAYDHQHFKTFITADDVKRVADWRIDHIRLPVDYFVLEDDRKPGIFKESGFGYIESCLNWCKGNGMRLILDLHKAPGYSFDALDESSLFMNPVLQERFLGLWQAITERFAERMIDMLAFELLNEIVLPNSDPWNQLFKQAVVRIRALDPQRLIIIGGNHYNAPDELKNLEVLDDPNILYTFHFYRPLTITHQKVPWLPALIQYNQAIEYPGQAVGLDEFLKANPEHNNLLRLDVADWYDKKYLQSVLQPALDFSKRVDQPIYCGEFGVYERAHMTTRLNWTREVIALLNEHDIGHAIWTYKNLDFGLVDKNGRIVNQELIRILSQP